jgi:hypothetical protein
MTAFGKWRNSITNYSSWQQMDESGQLYAEVALPQTKNNQVSTEHNKRWEPEPV